jgi:hypothetical protein
MRNKVEIQMRIAEVERNIKTINENRNQALKTSFFERDKNVFIFWHLEERVNRTILNELKWFLEDEFLNPHDSSLKEFAY